jgi:uncharacterized protein YbbC (DUF1343 family)/CubicO group peptidase (beta-lactamase class C family)
MHRFSFVLVALVAFVFTLPVTAGPSTSQQAASQGSPGLDQVRLGRIGELVAEAIKARSLPGAVVLVGRDDRVLYLKAFGNRALEPKIEPMTTDTIFDMASVTKVVATTTSVMILVEEGRVRLSDRVASFIPGFERYGKSDITVRHLLTHLSGLRPDLDMTLEFSGSKVAIERASEEVPIAAPGERFVYSDINFFLLGEIVSRVSGMGLDRFAKTRIFEPLGMRDTMFNPPGALGPRVAPTERCTLLGWPCDGPGAAVLRGVVHDPTARRMGGVAGHAGLFSTAGDLSLFCRMILNGGRLTGRQVLSPLGVAKMTTAGTPPGSAAVRGLGWDLDTTYSSNRGELMPIGSFGHTGFTGTSIWIDPLTRTYVVFLSNRVHPDGKGDVTPLRAKVATVVASAIIDPAPPAVLRSARLTGGDFGPSGAAIARERALKQPVSAGIDVLRAEMFKPLQGKRVGLLTNNTGRSRTGETTIDLLFKAPGVQLVALFSPEHGIRGVLDSTVPSSKDEKTGLPIHSLYGETTRPTSEMLDGLDTIVIDLQNIGARFYTYETTMAWVMEEAARRKIAVMVLDRPNPINGFDIEGPVIDESQLGFTAYFRTPTRHGMTMGELARLYNAEKKIGADLAVVEMKGWRRDLWYDETGFPWTNPSPNMRNLLQATLYPGIGAIEGTNISVGRGTDTPFEWIGAPWIDGARLGAELNARNIPGVSFYPVSFTPISSKYANELCQGVFILVMDRDVIRPVRVGLEVATALFRMYPAQYKLDAAHQLLGSRDVLARVRAGEDPARIAASWANDEARWRLLRAPYLLYR